MDGRSIVGGISSCREGDTSGKAHFKLGRMEGSSNVSEKRVCPPFYKVMEDICTKLEGIERLEKKVTEVADSFTGELGQIRGRMANLTVESKKNSGEIESLKGSIEFFSCGMQSTNEKQEEHRVRITELENINYEMSVKIEELERCNAKLTEDMKLYEEREKRRKKGARPKVLGILDTDQEEKIMKEEEE